MNRGTAHRRSRALDGEWSFTIDPDEVGFSEGWQTTPSRWVETADTVDVPHAWQEIEANHGYTGTAWYHRSITIDDGDVEGKRAFLEFGAADYWTTVWIDGQKVGENRGGYLPFEFDVTDALEAGENTLVVAVSDPEDLSEIPHGKQGDPWYTRVSGIWQSVVLHFRPHTHVIRAAVTPDLRSDAARVDLEVECGPYDPTAVQAVVRASVDGEVEALDVQSVGERSPVWLDFDDVEYWSPDSPTLYELEITLTVYGETVDRYEDTFGMRSIERDGDRYLLNGEPIRLRGVLDQGYYPKTLYRPPSSDTFEREIETMKRLGFNLVRKHVKPAHPDFLEAADRLGILVWEEPANPSRYTTRSKEEVKTQLQGMLERDYNRPSVVIWSLYNEEWGIGHYDAEEALWTDEARQLYLASLVETVREWDPTRMVCDNSGWAHVDTDVNDYHRYYVSPDRATAWEDNLVHMLHHPGDNYATRRWSEPDVPVIISEFGTWALTPPSTLRDRYGREPPWFSHDFLVDPMKRPEGVEKRFVETDLEDAFGTIETLTACWETRASTSLEHILKEIRKRDEIAGFVLTQLSDIEWEFNGLLDYFREEKSFCEEFAVVNADVAVFADVDSHVSWSGEDRRLEFTVVNDTGDRLSGDLEWRFGDETGRQSVTIPPHSVVELDPVETVVPSTDAIHTESVTAEFTGDVVLEDTLSVTVVPPLSRSTPGVTIFAEGTLASRLAGLGFEVTHTLSEDVDLAFVWDITDDVTTFLHEGGCVVQIPSRQGEMVHNDFFTFRSGPQTESWNMAAAFLYQNSPLLEGLCSDRQLGWEFENAYPYDFVTDVDMGTDTVHAGYVEGWLAGWGSPLLERPVGDGLLVACTFPVQTTVASHPVMTVLVSRLIDRLSDE